MVEAVVHKTILACVAANQKSGSLSYTGGVYQCECGERFSKQDLWNLDSTHPQNVKRGR